MNLIPNLTQVYRIVAQEEDHKEFSQNVVSDSLAFVADRKNYYQGQNSYSQTQGFKPQGQSNFVRKKP